MDTKATPCWSRSWSSCISFVEESLLLPTHNVGLFAATFLVIFAHTFVSLAVAVYFAHPLAASLLNDIQALRTTGTWSYGYSVLVDRTREHARKLFFIFVADHASRIATQLVAARATSVTTTYSGGYYSTGKSAKRAIGGLIVTGALVAVLELTSTAIIAVLFVSSWTYADPGAASICSYLLCLLALLFYVCLGTVLTVSVAVSAVDEDCHSIWALRRAWRFTTARRREAAVLVLIVSLLPALVYPAAVYAFSFLYLPDWLPPFNAHPDTICLLGVVSGSSLPYVGAQLFSMVAATVFCCRSRGTKEGN